MSNLRLPGPMCTLLGSWEIDAGTMSRSRSPTPAFSLQPPTAAPRVEEGAHGAKVISGLLFPLAAQATADYTSGARRFGSNRAGGRKHAGIDLYAPAGTIVRAMADGKVVATYPFYAGTWAIEIDHGSFMARYGEVDGKDANIFVERNDKVKRGDKLALVGKLVGISVPSNMLHLEMYASSRHEPLTVRANKPFQRRSDLMDPTASIAQAAFE